MVSMIKSSNQAPCWSVLGQLMTMRMMRMTLKMMMKMTRMMITMISTLSVCVGAEDRHEENK